MNICLDASRGSAAKAAFSILGLARLVISPSTPMDCRPACIITCLHNQPWVDRASCCKGLEFFCEFSSESQPIAPTIIVKQQTLRSENQLTTIEESTCRIPPTGISVMQLEFVNVSGAEPWKNKEAKKFVRSHAMKDFRRRQRERAAKHLMGKSSHCY
jgi:hypothetical protein